MNQPSHPTSLWAPTTTPQEALRRAVTIVGSQSKLARSIGKGLTQAHISHWLKKAKVVPAQHCPDIEHIVNRAVMCEELNPTVNWSFIRNTPPYLPDHPSDEPNDQIQLL